MAIIGIYHPSSDGVKKAKLFANGRSQAVRLPKEFRFPGTEVYIERRGEEVVLRPVNCAYDQAPKFKTLGELVEHFRATGGVSEDFATAIREARERDRDFPKREISR